jgi:flagellar basal-body rod modification protein FlgD
MASNTNGIGSSSSVLDQLAIKSNSTAPAKTLSQDTFLKLMIAQMNNQDPNKPMESGQFLTQLSQFGQLNGITQLQKSFDSLASSLQSNQALQASTMVGRTVSLEANKITTATAGQGVSGSVTLPAATGAVNLKVFDGAGQLVKEIPLGAQPAGEVKFAWEGMDAGGNAAPAGTYQFVVDALINGNTMGLTTKLDARVESVSLGSGGSPSKLNLAGLGSVGIDSVKTIK